MLNLPSAMIAGFPETSPFFTSKFQHLCLLRVCKPQVVNGLGALSVSLPACEGTFPEQTGGPFPTAPLCESSAVSLTVAL